MLEYKGITLYKVWIYIITLIFYLKVFGKVKCNEYSKKLKFYSSLNHFGKRTIFYEQEISNTWMEEETKDNDITSESNIISRCFTKIGLNKFKAKSATQKLDKKNLLFCKMAGIPKGYSNDFIIKDIIFKCHKNCKSCFRAPYKSEMNCFSCKRGFSLTKSNSCELSKTNLNNKKIYKNNFKRVLESYEEDEELLEEILPEEFEDDEDEDEDEGFGLDTLGKFFYTLTEEGETHPTIENEESLSNEKSDMSYNFRKELHPLFQLAKTCGDYEFIEGGFCVKECTNKLDKYAEYNYSTELVNITEKVRVCNCGYKCCIRPQNHIPYYLPNFVNISDYFFYRLEGTLGYCYFNESGYEKIKRRNSYLLGFEFIQCHYPIYGRWEYSFSESENNEIEKKEFRINSPLLEGANNIAPLFYYSGYNLTEVGNNCLTPCPKIKSTGYFYFPNNHTCYSCTNNCLECDGLEEEKDGHCIKCNERYPYLEDGFCKLSCSNGKAMLDGKCQIYQKTDKLNLNGFLVSKCDYNVEAYYLCKKEKNICYPDSSSLIGYSPCFQVIDNYSLYQYVNDEHSFCNKECPIGFKKISYISSEGKILCKKCDTKNEVHSDCFRCEEGFEKDIFNRCKPKCKFPIKTFYRDVFCYDDYVDENMTMISINDCPFNYHDENGSCYEDHSCGEYTFMGNNFFCEECGNYELYTVISEFTGTCVDDKLFSELKGCFNKFNYTNSKRNDSYFGCVGFDNYDFIVNYGNLSFLQESGATIGFSVLPDELEYRGILKNSLSKSCIKKKNYTDNAKFQLCEKCDGENIPFNENYPGICLPYNKNKNTNYGNTYHFYSFNSDGSINFMKFCYKFSNDLCKVKKENNDYNSLSLCTTDCRAFGKLCFTNLGTFESVCQDNPCEGYIYKDMCLDDCSIIGMIGEDYGVRKCRTYEEIGYVYYNNKWNQFCENQEQVFYDGKCQEKCPDGLGRSIQSSLCIDCKSKNLYLNKTSQRCVLSCDGLSYNRICISKCPQGTGIISEDEFSNTCRNCSYYGNIAFNNYCIKNCPLSAPFIYNGECLENCPENFGVFDETYICENCSFYFGLRSELNYCVDSQNKSFKDRISNCDDDIDYNFITTTSNEIEITCKSQNKFFFENKCITKEEIPINYCYNPDHPKNYNSEENYIIECFEPQSDGTYISYKIDSEVCNCFQDCPSENYYIINKKCYPCYFTCQSCLGKGNITNHNCKSCISSYKIQEGTNNCIYECENKYFDIYYNETICQSTCKSELFFDLKAGNCISDEACINKIYKNYCVEKCPNNSKELGKYCLIGNFSIFNLNTNTTKVMNSLEKLNNLSQIEGIKINCNDGNLTFCRHYLNKKNESIYLSQNKQCENLANSLDMTNCDQKIKSKYQNLEYLIKMEVLGGQLRYYDNTLNEINITEICQNESISELLEVNEKLKSEIKKLNELGVNPYNESDEFFKDRCISYTDSNGNDVSLDKRNSNYLIKNNGCSDGCTFSKLDEESQKAICDCPINKISNNEGNDGMGLVLSYVGDSILPGIDTIIESGTIKVVKCYKEAFQQSKLKKNYGFWLYLVFIILETILLILMIFHKFTKFTRYIYNLINLKNKEKKNEASQVIKVTKVTKTHRCIYSNNNLITANESCPPKKYTKKYSEKNNPPETDSKIKSARVFYDMDEISRNRTEHFPNLNISNFGSNNSGLIKLSNLSNEEGAQKMADNNNISQDINYFRGSLNSSNCSFVKNPLNDFSGISPIDTINNSNNQKRKYVNLNPDSILLGANNFFDTCKVVKKSSKLNEGEEFGSQNSSMNLSEFNQNSYNNTQKKSIKKIPEKYKKFFEKQNEEELYYLPNFPTPKIEEDIFENEEENYDNKDFDDDGNNKEEEKSNKRKNEGDENPLSKLQDKNNGQENNDNEINEQCESLEEEEENNEKKDKLKKKSSTERLGKNQKNKRRRNILKDINNLNRKMNNNLISKDNSYISHEIQTPLESEISRNNTEEKDLNNKVATNNRNNNEEFNEITETTTTYTVNKTKEKEDEEEEELNDADFETAMIKDKRTFCEIYCSLLSSKQLFLSICFSKIKYIPWIIRAAICIFIIGFYFTLVALLTDEEEINNRFDYGKIDFIYILKNEFSNVAYTALISTVVHYLVSFIFMSHNIKKLLIDKTSSDEIYLDNLNKALKQIKCKYVASIIFFIIFFICSLFFIVCFCSVYPGSQIEWMITSLLTIGLLFLVNFITYFISAVLRKIANTKKSWILFNLSNVFANII